MAVSNLSRRLGRFSMPADIVRDRPELARSILSGCVVVRAEPTPKGSRIDYVALREDFDVVSEGEHPPRYDPVTDGLTCFWVRLDAPREPGMVSAWSLERAPA